MTGKDRTAAILRLAAPLILVFVCQNAMFAARLAMLGQLGDAPLAGVGVGNAVLLVFTALLFGLDTGVQALAARRNGAGDTEGASAVLHGGIAIGIIAGVALAALVIAAAPYLLTRILSDAKAAASGTSYAVAAAPSLLFIGINSAFAAFWNGTHRPALSFAAMAVEMPLNILLSLALIFGLAVFPRLEAGGAGLAMTMAALAGTGIHLLFAARRNRVSHFSGLLPGRPGMVAILKIGAPVSAQQSLLYVGTLIFYGIAAMLGTPDVAATNVIMALALFSIMPATGIGIAAATLTGTALGRGTTNEAEKWGWHAAALGALVVAPLSLVFLAAPGTVLNFFMEDSATAKLATLPLMLFSGVMSIDAFGRILGFALRGAGATRPATIIPFFCQWGLMLPLSWAIGVHLGFGLVGIAATRAVITLLEAASYSFVWAQGSWRGESAAHERPTPRSS